MSGAISHGSTYVLFLLPPCRGLILLIGVGVDDADEDTEDDGSIQTGWRVSLPAMTVVGIQLEDRFMPDDSMVVSRLRLWEYSGVVELE